MPTLVLPDRTIQRIPNKGALKEWADACGIHWKLRENLSQLLGFDQPPTAGVTVGRSRADHFLLEDTTWIYHPTRQAALPLFGTYPQKFKQLQLQAAPISFSVSTFKRLHQMRGQQSEDGWWVGVEPAAVAALPDGGSLLGLAAQPSGEAMPAAQPPLDGLPDYGARTAAQSACADGHHVAATGSLQVLLGLNPCSSARAPRCRCHLVPNPIHLSRARSDRVLFDSRRRLEARRLTESWP